MPGEFGSEAGRALCEYEALIRWPNSDYSPIDFLPVAKLAGLIDPITKFVVFEVAAMLESLTNQGQYIWVSVNISEDSFMRHIRSAMESFKYAPQSMVFEVTEDTVIDSQIIDKMKIAKSLGHLFKIDDFGTSGANLYLLRVIDAEALKLDAQFVTSAHQNSNLQAICRNSASLAKELNPPLQIIAEGVETLKDFEFCLEVGFEFAQGWFVGMPAPSTLHASAYTEDGRKND